MGFICGLLYDFGNEVIAGGGPDYKCGMNFGKFLGHYWFFDENLETIKKESGKKFIIMDNEGYYFCTDNINEFVAGLKMVKAIHECKYIESDISGDFDSFSYVDVDNIANKLEINDVDTDDMVVVNIQDIIQDIIQDYQNN